MTIYRSMTLLCAFFLASCGGGGGSSSEKPASSAAAVTFPLARAFAAFVEAGSTTSYSATGACTGTVTIIISAPVPTTFAGASALAASQSVSSVGCPGFTNQRTLYYNTAVAQVGFDIVGGLYGVAQSPLSMPATVVAGSSGPLGTFTVWTDSSQTVPAGQLVVTYAVAADTSNAALVTLTKVLVNPAQVATETDQNQYRISTSGDFSPTSASAQYQNSPSSSYVLTAN